MVDDEVQQRLAVQGGIDECPKGHIVQCLLLHGGLLGCIGSCVQGLTEVQN